MLMRRRRGSRAAAEVRDYLDEHYAGWTVPPVTARAFIGSQPGLAERAPAVVTRWLRERGLEVEWLQRITVGEGAAPITTVEPPRVGTMAAPVVFGEVVDQDEWFPLRIQSQGGRFCTFSDALITGAWDVIETPRGACWPALTSQTEARLVSNALEARVIGWTPALFCLEARPRIVIAEEERAISLVGEHSTHFGHWLTDYLPRMLATRSLDTEIPVIVDAGHHQSSRWWLDRLAPGRRVVEINPGESVRVAQAIVPLSRTFCPTGWPEDMPLTADVWASDPWGASMLQCAAVDPLPSPRRRERRLWLGRRSGNKPLVNHDELASLMARTGGFETVFPEDVPLEVMSQLLDSATDVIAPIGSQLFNLLIARPGLRVLVLVGHDAMQTRGGVVSYGTAAGHSIALLGGTTLGAHSSRPYEEKQRPFRVDAADLLNAAERFFADGPTAA